MFLFFRATFMPLVLTGLVACSPSLRPVAKAGRPLPLPERYDATPYPTPELAISLTQVFGSAQLKALQRRGVSNNPDLAQAGAVLDEAGFNLTQTRSALLPTLNNTISGTRSRQVGLFSGSIGLIGASLDAAWELDVWGRIQSGIDAATSDQTAVAADYESAKQSLLAQITQAYFDVVAANQLLELARREQASFTETVALTERRFERGTVSLSDLQMAKTDAASAAADIQVSLEVRDTAARALKILLGDYPDAELNQFDSWPSLQRSVPAGIPSSLLRERPDVDAAFQRIRAADSRVDVAHAELFPSFALTGSAGRTSTTLEGLTKPDSNVWNFGTNIVTPIFASGALRDEVRAANARAEQAFENYRSVALVAFQEVENALSAETRLRDEQVAREKALTNAKGAESRAQRDFEMGTGDFLSLLVSQRLVFDTEERAINVRASRYNNRVALALALGKGF